MKNHTLIMGLLLSFCVNSQASIVSDFAWIPSGANNAANTTINGVRSFIVRTGGHGGNWIDRIDKVASTNVIYGLGPGP